MEKHGFIVLTETGAIRDAYVEFMELLKAFFDGDSEFKESCKGGVHFNERGIPMVRKVWRQRRAVDCVSVYFSPTKESLPMAQYARSLLSSADD